METNESKLGQVRNAFEEYVEGGGLDRHLDTTVEFLRANGFGGQQLRHVFGLRSRHEKMLYIASVAGLTVAVTFYSRSLVGRTLRKVPFLSWA